MKSKDLIEKLREIDPTGDIDVCIENNDIHMVEIFHAGHQGMFRKNLFEDEKNPRKMTGVKYVYNGQKIELGTFTIWESLSVDRNTPIDMTEIPKQYKKLYDDRVAQYRESPENYIDHSKWGWVDEDE